MTCIPALKRNRWYFNDLYPCIDKEQIVTVEEGGTVTAIVLY